jgi:polygalacturonase/PKD repeat protein
LLLAVAGSGHADPDLPIIPATNFNVLSYGAYGNGVSNNATAIQNAINAANTAGGGTVEIPANGTLSTYLCGPLTMLSSVNLQIDTNAMLQMLPYSTWEPAHGSTTFILGNGSSLHDMEITGGGTIDGQGGSGWWTCGCSRPDFIEFEHIQRVLIQGVTLQNPPTFHIMVHNSNGNLTIQNITINTPSTSPNTDGIDLASTNVLIRNCYISDGDDNIQIGSSAAYANNITISNCTFGTGHGLSIGSPTQDGVSNLLVNSCTWNGTEYGIHIKTDRGIGGLIHDLTYQNLVMSNVDFVIAFYMYYDELGAPMSDIDVTPFMASTDVVQTVTSTTPVFHNITISNVTASSINGNIAGIIWGLPESLVSNVTMTKVNISAPTTTFCIYNATGIQILDSNLTAPTTGTNTLTLYNAGITITNSAANTNLVTLGGLAAPPTNNVLGFFSGLASITDTNELGAGSITLGGSTLTLTEGSVNFSNNLNVVSNSTLAVTSGTNIYTGALSGAGALTVNPGGSFLMFKSASPNYSGSLTVSNGTLLVDNTTGSGTGSGAVTIVAGGTLGGTGVVAGPVTVNGTLSPGNSPGTLTVSNNLVVNSGAVLQYQLGATSDLTKVSGNLTLGGTLNVSNAGGFTNTTYPLFTYGGTLTYNTVTVGTTPKTNFTYTISTNTAGQVNLIVALPAILPVASFTNNPATGPAPLTVNFYDTSTGSPTSWSWTFGDGIGTSTAQDPSYTYDYPGTYTVTQIVANTAGSSTNTGTITVSPYTFAQWQQFYGLTGPLSGPSASYTGDGMSNTNKFMAGFNPTNAAAYLHVISIQEQSVSGNTNVVVTYLGANGDDSYTPGIASRTNVLDYMNGSANGSYTNGGWQDTGQTNILSGGNGSGTVTNMTDSNITASPARYYRVRVLLP